MARPSPSSEPSLLVQCMWADAQALAHSLMDLCFPPPGSAPVGRVQAPEELEAAGGFQAAVAEHAYLLVSCLMTLTAAAGPEATNWHTTWGSLPGSCCGHIADRQLLLSAHALYSGSD